MKQRQIVMLVSAKWIVQLIYVLSRSLNLGEGSNIPGKIVLKLFPNLLDSLVSRFKNGWILVTGTNGKTTSTRILVEILRQNGLKICTNSQGANLISGIVTSILLSDIRLTEEFAADYAVFEIDEAVLIKNFNLLQPRILVVTNFSRDQLDRYGEVDSNVNRIMELVKNSAFDCKIVLNGNDPNIARIGSVAKREACFYFGMKEEIASLETGLLIEKETGTGLEEYDLPALDLWAGEVETEYLNGSRFTMGYGQEKLTVNIQLPGIFNVLNALAAAAVSLSIGIELTKITAILGKVTSSFGRSEHFQYRDSSVFLFLVKNPVGFNHIIQLLTQAKGNKRILLLLNDLTADGKDVSWIWDISLENLWKVPRIKEIVTSGTRAGDMALRVKYSNPPDLPLVVNYSPRQAFKDLMKRIVPGEEVLILANYTSMITFRPYLLRVCRWNRVS